MENIESSNFQEYVLSDLPDELLHHIFCIFGDLGERLLLSQINRRFCHILSTIPSDWKKTSLFYGVKNPEECFKRKKNFRKMMVNLKKYSLQLNQVDNPVPEFYCGAISTLLILLCLLFLIFGYTGLVDYKWFQMWYSLPIKIFLPLFLLYVVFLFVVRRIRHAKSRNIVHRFWTKKKEDDENLSLLDCENYSREKIKVFYKVSGHGKTEVLGYILPGVNEEILRNVKIELSIRYSYLNIGKFGKWIRWISDFGSGTSIYIVLVIFGRIVELVMGFQDSLQRKIFLNFVRRSGYVVDDDEMVKLIMREDTED